MSASAPLVTWLLRHGDDRLVLGHRLSEWCGHGPILEEDIAMANIALDLLGQATMFLRLAGQEEGAGRDEDRLAYWRVEREFRNAELVELPKGDYAFTIVRLFLFAAYAHHHLGALAQSSHAELAGIAAKAHKECRYHLRHAGEWLVRMGDGTEESRRRAQAALDDLWPWTGELFAADGVERALVAGGIISDPALLRAPFEAMVQEQAARATLALPEGPMRMTGGRRGRHTEHLGHLLAEMQIVARSHPGAAW